GAVEPAGDSGRRIRVAGGAPLELADRALRRVERPVNVYTWPARLAAADLDRRIELTGTNVNWRAGRGDIVTDLQPGAWVVDGLASRPVSYLLQWDEEHVTEGTLFVARGELLEGGLQVGFLSHE